jgi:hypothetical protein
VLGRSTAVPQVPSGCGRSSLILHSTEGRAGTELGNERLQPTEVPSTATPATTRTLRRSASRALRARASTFPKAWNFAPPRGASIRAEATRARTKAWSREAAGTFVICPSPCLVAAIRNVL